MNPNRPRRRPPRFRVAWLAWAVVAATVLGAAPARAQAIRPWLPPSADSLQQWASEARVRFQGARGDSIGGENLRAYELVGQMGRRLVRSLGRANVNQALAIEPMLDSLGLDVDVRIDPEIPNFVLLMVRNPYRRTAQAVGYLYWYRENDLRMQGSMFAGGVDPSMRVWWTNREEAPYSWAVVERERPDRSPVRLTLFRLVPSGAHWLVQQYGEGADLGPGSRVSWPDLDGDLRPELVAWSAVGDDSLFQSCRDCPDLIQENIFVERPEGFRLLDSRRVPTPYAVLTLFVRALVDGNRATAARLLVKPADVDAALRAGWGVRRGPAGWRVESSEPGTPWPRWLIASFGSGAGLKRYIVHFEQTQGRWVIRDWQARTTGAGARGPGAGTGRP